MPACSFRLCVQGHEHPGNSTRTNDNDNNNSTKKKKKKKKRGGGWQQHFCLHVMCATLKQYKKLHRAHGRWGTLLGWSLLLTRRLGALDTRDNLVNPQQHDTRLNKQANKKQEG